MRVPAGWTGDPPPVQMHGAAAPRDKELRADPSEPRLNLAPTTSLSPVQVYLLILCAPAAGISLILANKMLMQGFGFSFSGLLVAAHFGCTALVLHVLASVGVFEEKRMELRDRVVLGVVGALAILLGTSSLNSNSLGTFLATNMLTTPSTVFFRFLWEGKRYDARVLGALGLVVAGVALHTSGDHKLGAGPGFGIALLSVVCNAAYQVLQKMRQDSLKINAGQMLQQVAPIVAGAGVLVTVLLELPGLLRTSWSFGLVSALGLTAGMAVLSNVAAGALIGVTSPVTFQVTGYVKTCILFLASLAWEYVGGDHVRVGVSTLGVPVALLGAILYGLWVKG